MANTRLGRRLTKAGFLLLFLAAASVCIGWIPEARHPRRARSGLPAAKLSQADRDRLLASEPALTAFIVAEMRDFLTRKSREPRANAWELGDEELVRLGWADPSDPHRIVHEGYASLRAGTRPEEAIDRLCNATEDAFRDGYTNEQGLLSALGAAILFFKNALRTPALLAACEVVGVSDYAVAHHITDMYHHRTFRGAYTKTLAPSGKGEIAARKAVGLWDNDDVKAPGKTPEQTARANAEDDTAAQEEADECLLWSPTTEGVCLHWKSDDEAWRKKRFERIQMEGTRDPRRGGSGTTR